MASMRRSLPLVALFLILHAAVMRGQDAAPPAAVAEHFGVGVFGAIGTSALRAFRVSMPLGTNAGLDVDIGRVPSRDDPNRAIGVQVRYLRRGRQTTGASGYWLFGVLRVNETHRYWASAGRTTWEVVERRTPTLPQVGYGWDWQGRRGTRLGFELTTGSEGEAGPRVFAKVFVVWGPPLKP
jgi:hypothetical protein